MKSRFHSQLSGKFVEFVFEIQTNLSFEELFFHLTMIAEVFSVSSSRLQQGTEERVSCCFTYVWELLRNFLGALRIFGVSRAYLEVRSRLVNYLATQPIDLSKRKIRLLAFFELVILFWKLSESLRRSRLECKSQLTVNFRKRSLIAESVRREHQN